MKYLLDTNIPSYLEEQASPFHAKTKECLSRLSDDDEIFLHILILYELRYSISLTLIQNIRLWGWQG